MTIQLTDAQRSILGPACARDDLCIYPVTAELKGGAVGNVCRSLLKRGLIEELPAIDDHTVWRHGEEGPLTLRVSEVGRQAVDGVTEKLNQSKAPVPSPAPQAATVGRRPSGRDLLLGLLRRPTGATIADMAEATGWQSHSVPGALSGIIGKKLGLKVVSEKSPERGRVYRIG